MSLLWVPRGHVALTSAVLEGTLTDCGPSNDSPCLTVVNSKISMNNVLSTSSMTREADRDLNS